jgi:uncharacterized protein
MPVDLDCALEGLCLGCALCCDGTIFHDVRLRPGEKAGPLKALGLPVRKRGNLTFLAQPCAALDGTRCQAYAVRPRHCRKFDCRLFQAVKEGETAIARARSVVRATQKQAAVVRRLLARLEAGRTVVAGLDLRQRYTQLALDLEISPATPEQAAVFGDLTLAYHRLNLRLRKYFVDQ